MTTGLREILEQAEGQCGPDGTTDITMTCQMIYNTADRQVLRAELSGILDGKPRLQVIAGLRSTVLEPFDRFGVRVEERYMPCDIFGLVPALGLIVSDRKRSGLEESVLDLSNGVPTLILNFIASDMRTLAGRVGHFMKQWREWTAILMDVLKRDPVIGDWQTDLRELMAGESGFVTMPWFRPLNLIDRSVALERIVAASRALLSSILNSEEYTHTLIRELMDWLDTLAPRPQVVSTVEGVVGGVA